MDRIFYHLKYLRDNPPAGTMLKAFFESLSKKGKKKNKRQSYQDFDNAEVEYDDGSQVRPKSFENDEERLRWEENQLAALIQIFGGSGGIVRRKQEGGK